MMSAQRLVSGRLRPSANHWKVTCMDFSGGIADSVVENVLRLSKARVLSSAVAGLVDFN